MDAIPQADVIDVSRTHAGVGRAPHPLHVFTERQRLVERSHAILGRPAREHRSPVPSVGAVVPDRFEVRRPRLTRTDKRLGQTEHQSDLRMGLEIRNLMREPIGRHHVVGVENRPILTSSHRQARVPRRRLTEMRPAHHTHSIFGSDVRRAVG